MLSDLIQEKHMADWYYMAGGEKFGPVSNDELKKLAAAGHFEPTDKVWKEGLQDWVDASTMKGLFDGRPAKTAEGATKTASAASKRKASKPRVNGEHPGYLPHLKFVDKFLDLARGILSEKLLDSLDGICRMAGHISLMVYVVICLGMGIFIGIKVDSFRLVLMASAILPIGLA
ncbi:MAG: DUF4339 domain-containing protein, partial [Planctomycetota bacterium]|nr:DUF4339 domain-containing protein [Planctomycetota bacterium]